MADLLIKGMEMPKSCGDCPFLYDHDACYVSGMWNDMRFMLLCFNGHTDEYRLGEFPFKEKRVDWCPLVEIPPHGRLIDEREAYDKIAEQEGGNYVDMDAVGRGLEETTTVIEASEDGGEDETAEADYEWSEEEQAYIEQGYMDTQVGVPDLYMN